ncbi:hypothetical protein E4T56_gene20598 [Termitomyces sp. T112]|nr:hypothetical protein E4T56_gene20598 [Termitomyces sp. T112]
MSASLCTLLPLYYCLQSIHSEFDGVKSTRSELFKPPFKLQKPSSATSTERSPSPTVTETITFSSSSPNPSSVVTSQPRAPNSQPSSTNDTGTTASSPTAEAAPTSSGLHNPDTSSSSSDSTLQFPSANDLNSQQGPSLTIPGAGLAPSNIATSTSTPASHKVNVSAIAGGILGALVFISLLFYVVVLVRRRRRRSPSAEFLNWSFQGSNPSFAGNPPTYPFGSTHVTSSHSRSLHQLDADLHSLRSRDR